jgi:hypothetical protein
VGLGGRDYFFVGGGISFNTFAKKRLQFANNIANQNQKISKFTFFFHIGKTAAADDNKQPVPSGADHRQECLFRSHCLQQTGPASEFECNCLSIFPHKSIIFLHFPPLSGRIQWGKRFRACSFLPPEFRETIFSGSSRYRKIEHRHSRRVALQVLLILLGKSDVHIF